MNEALREVCAGIDYPSALSELYVTWGNLGQGSLPFRDEFDLPFEQVAVDAWTAFARN